jgi:hypothetical protein
MKYEVSRNPHKAFRKPPESPQERKSVHERPFKYYVSKEVGGWGQKFLLIYSTIYAEVGRWVGLKKPKS